MVLGALAVTAALSAAMVWLRWPVECAQTGIGFEAGQPDPNLHACATRSGASVSLDNARLSAVAWAQGASIGLLVAAGLAALRTGWVRPPSPGTVGQGLAILAVAALLGLMASRSLWPETCTTAAEFSSGGQALICSTPLGIELDRGTARLTAMLWGEATAVTALAIGGMAASRRQRRSLR
ncbi:MAG: hypothetical protein O3A10_07825 [Chloroflexi bacterium]|nr:hypothetical protein [Chloroflexota bacterium]MDA1146383.1 hypothetical protein [Chloroflexota bacterium]